MTIEKMRELKKQKGYTYQQISEKSGIPLGTVQKIFCGQTKSPRYETMAALEKILMDENETINSREASQTDPASAGKPSGRESVQYDFYTQKTSFLGVKEGAFSYDTSVPMPGSDRYNVEKGNKEIMGKPEPVGRYTVEDYLALPEWDRKELIDGVFYDMAAPTYYHQHSLGWLYTKISAYVHGKKGRCLVFISPLDVQLNRDDYTIVQPDLVIVCDRNKFKDGRIYGAPDFIAEILSPSTAKLDQSLKQKKYRTAGVREYWMIDTKRRMLITFNYMNDMIEMHTFAEQIPVAIYGEDCIIDFNELNEELDALP